MTVQRLRGNCIYHSYNSSLVICIHQILWHTSVLLYRKDKCIPHVNISFVLLTTRLIACTRKRLEGTRITVQKMYCQTFPSAEVILFSFLTCHVTLWAAGTTEDLTLQLEHLVHHLDGVSMMRKCLLHGRYASEFWYHIADHFYLHAIYSSRNMILCFSRNKIFLFLFRILLLQVVNCAFS